MRAVVYDAYGGPEVLRLADVERRDPARDEISIRVRATTVTAADGLVRTGTPRWGRIILGLRRPRRRVIGTELAGDVVAVGDAVTRLAPGDAVYGFTGFGLGAYAEYCCMPERGSVAKMPSNVSYDEAAGLVDGTTTALFFLRDKAKLAAGQHVLINGASGSVGGYAVQVARYLGAEVTGVCSGKNREHVKSLGAHHVIDYTEEDFTRGAPRYDVVFDAVAKSSFSRCKPVLAPRGVYTSTALSLSMVLYEAWTLFRKQRAIWGMSVDKTESLHLVRELVEDGTIHPVIDRRYRFDEIVEAHRYVDTGRKRGNVVISVP